MVNTSAMFRPDLQCWADELYGTIQAAYVKLQRAEDAFYDEERNAIIEEVIENLGRIVDPTSKDLGEPS